MESKSGLGPLEQGHEILFRARHSAHINSSAILLSYNCPDRWSCIFLLYPLTTTLHFWPPLLYLFRILPPPSPPRRCTSVTLFTLLLLQIHGHSCCTVRDAITQSASFEKERLMNPLSPFQTKGNGEVQVAFSNEDNSF